jgi:signal transduction histidine kinase
MTENLQQVLQKLSQQEAVAAVGEFAASLAHEVRNPLTSVSVDLQRTQRKIETEPEEARALVERALGEIERLNESVSDFLRVARSGRVILTPVDLRLPLEAAVRAAEPHFQTKGATLEYATPAESICVQADVGAIEQLVLNLLLNSADELDAGGRAGLAVEVRESAVRVSIRDDGPGIAPDQLGKMFEPFFTTKEEGTGLGLTVAQRIARAHGSELQVESAPGSGTTFHFTLPIEASRATPIVPAAPKPGNES